MEQEGHFVRRALEKFLAHEVDANARPHLKRRQLLRKGGNTRRNVVTRGNNSGGSDRSAQGSPVLDNELGGGQHLATRKIREPVTVNCTRVGERLRRRTMGIDDGDSAPSAPSI